jgi:hypothetical protein
MPKYKTRKATAFLFMLDKDWIVTIEYTRLNQTYNGSHRDLPEFPHYYIYRIWLSEDVHNNEGPRWELTGQMFSLISRLNKVDEAIMEDIQNGE